jgi:hypothetical protein
MVGQAVPPAALPPHHSCEETAHFSAAAAHVLIEVQRFYVFATNMPRLLRFGLLVCAASALAATGAAARPDPALSRAKALLARLPLRFEANRGQWDPVVRYAARANGYALLLTAGGPVVSSPASGRVAIRLLNSNRAAPIEPLDQLPARTDYFMGSREHWHTGIPTYSRVRYRAVYPGIDVVYYGNPNRLEYDFVLQPGADPRAIRLQFRGAGHLAITAEGDLAYESADARMVQERPVIYQEDGRTAARRAVQGRYVLMARNVVGIRLDRYDPTQALVIDPTLVYSTYMGGSGADQIAAAQLDASGHLYLAGSTATSDLVATTNTYQANNFGKTDIFIAIIDTTPGHGFPILYFSYAGGVGMDIPTAMVLDSSQDIYLTGTTNSSDFPTTSGAVQTAGAGSNIYSAFVFELNPGLSSGTSTLEYSTFLGGTTGNQTGNGIALDQNGNIYVIGTTKDTDFPVTANAYQSTLSGLQDAFLAEVTPGSTTLTYATYLGGELEADGRGIAIAPNGRVYFAASTNSTQFPLAGASYQTSLNGNYDLIIGSMDMTQSGTASLVYATYFGGSDNDEVRKLALDANGNLLLTGYTLSADFPVTRNAIQPAYGGNSDAFILVVNPANPAFLLYSSYLGGNDGEVGFDIEEDSAGFLYLTGYTISANFPATADAPQPGWGGGIDVFVTKLQWGATGPSRLIWSTYFGGTGSNSGLALVVGTDGTVYVAGYAGSQFPASSNATQGAFDGGFSDGFYLAISQP